MLSRTLFETVEEIKRCQESMPERYWRFGDELDALVSKMEELQISLDSPESKSG
jgi:hypothetical protein